MASQLEEPSAIVARLDRLEHENRRLKLAGLLACALAGAVLLWGPAVSQDGWKRTVTAKEFLLVDAAGKRRASLGFAPNGSPGLRVYDAAGENRASLGSDDGADGSPVLGLLDANGRARVWLASLGEDGSPSLGVSDAAGTPRASLHSAGEDGSPGVSLYDSDGKAIYSLP